MGSYSASQDELAAEVFRWILECHFLIADMVDRSAL